MCAGMEPPDLEGIKSRCRPPIGNDFRWASSVFCRQVLSIMSRRILFVCTGNTCRSPIAEVLATAQGIQADSAGVAAQRSNHATPFATRALRAARGQSLDDHTPQSVDALDLSAYDQIVAMAPTIAQQLRADYDVAPDRLITWTIPDPYGGSMADYRLCLEQIDTALTRLLSE